jgi:pimeloyl-ACP methyl ester carboxylesterase
MKFFIAPKTRFVVALIGFVVFSCKNDEEPTPERVIASAENVVGWSSSELRGFLGRAEELDMDLSSLKYDVDVYRITYKTHYKGEEVTASALVGLPLRAPDASIVSFQHGTIAAYSQAPTALELADPELILYTALSSPGFISVAPDLLGFGSSKDILHPYYVEEATADAVRDAIRAARDLAADKGIGFTGKLFLAGYSQGGYATMAAHKSIEAEPLQGMDLVASFPAAGGYDIKHMQEYFFGLEDYDQPFYLAFVAQAYKVNYNWSQPLTDVFNEPYATRIPVLVNGSKTNNQINDELTNNIPELVNADLLANIDTDSQYKYIVDAFNENSLTNWTPAVTMHMFHGDADTTVPYQNSVIAYNKLLANGASTSVVTLTTLEGADHTGGIFPYIELFFPMMLDLDK